MLPHWGCCPTQGSPGTAPGPAFSFSHNTTFPARKRLDTQLSGLVFLFPLGLSKVNNKTTKKGRRPATRLQRWSWAPLHCVMCYLINIFAFTVASQQVFSPLWGNFVKQDLMNFAACLLPPLLFEELYCSCLSQAMREEVSFFQSVDYELWVESIEFNPKLLLKVLRRL